MNRQTHRYTFLLGILLLTPTVWAKNFIFDLGGVLIDTNGMAAFQELGKTNVAKLIFQQQLNPLTVNSHIKTKLFEILDSVANLHFPENASQLPSTYDEHGDQLPYVMCAWLNGTLTCAQAYTITTETIATNRHWFDSHCQQRIISNLCRMIFTPERFIATRKLYKEGIVFINAIKMQGHKVFVLSNWDTESFALLQQKYPQLFDLFDGIVISGQANALKPSQTIYEMLLKQYNLNPQDCWFIDDQKENVDAAKNIGINAVICVHKKRLCGLHKQPDFKLVARTIKEHHSKSVTRRENLNSSGISVSSTKKTSNAIIEGENISLTDSTL